MPTPEYSPNHASRTLESILAEFDEQLDTREFSTPRNVRLFLKDWIEGSFELGQQGSQDNPSTLMYQLIIDLLRAEGHDKTAQLFYTLSWEALQLGWQEHKKASPTEALQDKSS